MLTISLKSPALKQAIPCVVIHQSLIFIQDVLSANVKNATGNLKSIPFVLEITILLPTAELRALTSRSIFHPNTLAPLKPRNIVMIKGLAPTHLSGSRNKSITFTHNNRYALLSAPALRYLSL